MLTESVGERNQGSTRRAVKDTVRQREVRAVVMRVDSRPGKNVYCA